MQTRLQMLALLTMVLAVIDADDAVADADDADDEADAADDTEAVMVLGCRGNWVWLRSCDANCKCWDLHWWWRSELGAGVLSWVLACRTIEKKTKL